MLISPVFFMSLLVHEWDPFAARETDPATIECSISPSIQLSGDLEMQSLSFNAVPHSKKPLENTDSLLPFSLFG